MARDFELEIITPERVFYKGRVLSLVAPEIKGFFGVLAHHAPLLARSSGGKVKVLESSRALKLFEIKSGLIEVFKNRVVILARSAKAFPN